VVFTSLPGPREVEAVALGNDGLLGSMRSGAVWFDLTTNSPSLNPATARAVRRSRPLHLLDAPVSGGPKGARTRKLALWVGGDRTVFDKYKTVLDALGARRCTSGTHRGGPWLAKLVHNCAGYAIQAALAEVFTLGVKGGVEPLALWQAVRQGALGRRRTFDRLGDQFLPGNLRAAGFHAAARPQGRDAGDRARPRAARAHARGRSRAGGADRGAQSRLERARLARVDAAAKSSDPGKDRGAEGEDPADSRR